MKSEILEALTDPSIVKIKHVKKHVFKKLGSEDVEDFDKAIKSLTKKNKIEVVGDKVRLLSSIEEISKKSNENESNTKRKRSVEDTSKNENEKDKSNDRKSKKEKTSGHTDTYELWKNGEAAWRNNTLEPSYLAQNPDKITRLFCGNLKKEITEEQLKEALPGVTFIKWIRDKETGEFYGTTFLEMNDAKSAASAVMKDRSKFMGRPLKIYYCPPKPGDVWPPLNATSTKPVGFAQSNGSNNPAALRAKTPKPPNCCKLFMGNLSYNIDDDTIVEFFKDCGGEMVGLRWLTHKDSGDFKGCGYVEFADTNTADQAFLLDGSMLLGRPIRIDWG